MDEIQGQQLPPSNEQKPNILEEVEFGMGGVLPPPSPINLL